MRSRWIPAAAAVTLVAAACAGVGANLGSSQPAQVKGVALDPTTTTAPAVPPPGDVAIAPPPERFDGPAPTPQPPPRRLAAGGRPGPGTWAVVVGINDYPGTAHDLRSAGADADDVNTALAGMGVPEDHRLVLKDGQVTRGVLRSAAQWLTDRAGPDAVAVFFFAGHVRKVGRSTEAMVAADGGTVTDAELAALLGGLQARRAWIVMAACFGGGFTEVLRPGRVLTGAAPADQEAYENLAFGRSYLVQYMVREAMIEGRAPDTVQSAFEYARTTIAATRPDREPIQLDQAGGPLDLRPPGVAPARAGSQQPQQSSAPEDGTGTTTTTAAPTPARDAVTSTPPRRKAPGTTTTTAPDKCRTLTGVLKCGSG